MKKTSLISLLIVALTVLVLALIGRSFGAPDGTLGFWTSAASGGDTSQRLFDPYTFTHIEHGVLLFLAAWIIFRRWSVSDRFLAVLAIEGIWEIAENTTMVINRYRETAIANGYFGDSILNSIGDILACMVGFWIAKKLPVWGTILFMIALEVLLYIFIRDNLALNIILLIYPFKALQALQVK